MASTRRIGAPDSKTRAMLLDAAEQLLLEEGYAAVTSRRVASKAALKPQLVHYYFRTMDDLFLEVYRRRADEGLERFQRSLSESRSLRAMWEFSTEPLGAAFNIEFVALANHRKEIRAEIAHYAERFRKMQLDAIAGVLTDHGVPADACPPVVVLLTMTGLSQVMALEDALGVTTGHEETISYVGRYIDAIEHNMRAATKRTAADRPRSRRST